MEIKWHYHYVHECKEVDPYGKIDLTPDKQNRWQLRGHIVSSAMEFPVIIVVIEKENDGFVTRLPQIDYSLGFAIKAFRSGTIPELVQKVHSNLERVQNILNGT